MTPTVFQHRPIALFSNFWHLPAMVGYNRYAVSLVKALQGASSCEWTLCGHAPEGVHPRLGEQLPGGRRSLKQNGFLGTQSSFQRADREIRPSLWHILTDEPVPLASRCPVVVTCHGIPVWMRVHDAVAQGDFPGSAWNYLDLPPRFRDRYQARRRGLRQRKSWALSAAAMFLKFARTRFLWHVYLRRADHILAVSAHVRRQLMEKFGIRKEKISVVPLAADAVFHQPEKATTPAARHGLPGRYLLAVSSFSQLKNTEGLLALAEDLCRAGSDARLVLAGPAGDKQPYADQARRRGLIEGRDIWFLENLKAAELAGLYRGAELLVNLSWIESFALPVVEAMACALPIVASCLTAVPEIVGDGGLLVDPRDRPGVARTVLQVLNSPELRNQLVERSRRRSQVFSWEKTARETLAVYQRLLSRCK